MTPTDPGPQRSAESHSPSAPYAGDDGFQGGAHGGAGWPGAVHDSGDAITGPLVSNLLCSILGCSSANAVAPGEAGQARVSHGQYAVEMAAALTAAKVLGAVAGVLGRGAGAGAEAAAARGGANVIRPLLSEDLGLVANATVEGTFGVRGSKATAYIKYLGRPPTGLGRGLLGARRSLGLVAKEEGATMLRIETSPIIEETGRLREILQKAGFGERPNGTMWWEGEL